MMAENEVTPLVAAKVCERLRLGSIIQPGAMRKGSRLRRDPFALSR